MDLYNGTHHTDGYGVVHVIADMELSHVGNLMRYLERNADRAAAALAYPMFNGDIAQMHAEGEWDWAQANPLEYVKSTPLYRALAARFAPETPMTTTPPITSIIFELRCHPTANIDRDDVKILAAGIATFSKASLNSTIAVLSYENMAGEIFEYSDDDDTPPHGIERPLTPDEEIARNIVNDNLAAAELALVDSSALMVLRVIECLIEYHDYTREGATHSVMTRLTSALNR